MKSISSFEEMAAVLEKTGDYKILRKIPSRGFIQKHEHLATKNGVFIDLETTGLDAEKDEIIELALVPFIYTLEGHICEIQAPYQALREPSIPIPIEITKITGITDEMVAGKKLSNEEIKPIISNANLIIAHNANFDRKFAEKLDPIFINSAWACSMSQIDWASEGYEGTKLSYLVNQTGFFYDGHRAADDCLAALELLMAPLAISKANCLAVLLSEARKQTYRIWAENAPFDLKDILKARGYRWNPEGNANPRSWYIDLCKEELENELIFLQKEIYQREIDLPIKEISAYDRFSDRC